MALNIITPGILDQIDLVRDSIKANPQYNLVKKVRELRDLKSAANRHSAEIEMQNGKKHGKALKTAIANLELAECYLTKDCKGILSDQALQVAAGLINGLSGQMLYRRESARVQQQDGSYLIYPDDVHGQMAQFLPKVNEIANPIEKAVYSHYHITRIHPFSDGNGRLARLVQNSVLACGDYPPILIDYLGREQYIGLLQSADNSYRKNLAMGDFPEVTSEQNKFYNFLAVKLRDSLVEIQGKIIGKK